jgi:hypothetical protein
MNRFGMIVGFLAAFLAGILVSDFLQEPNSQDGPFAADKLQPEDAARVDRSASSKPKTVGESIAESIPDRGSNNEADETDAPVVNIQSLESRVVAHNSINSNLVLESDSRADNFSKLVEEFRDNNDIKTAEQHEQFQQFFYSQDELLRGEIALDVLECGTQICVAELRSDDSSALRAFIGDGMDWDAFGSNTIVEVPTDQQNTTRLIFSHDPEIKGIALPPFGGWSSPISR